MKNEEREREIEIQIGIEVSVNILKQQLSIFFGKVKDLFSLSLSITLTLGVVRIMNTDVSTPGKILNQAQGISHSTGPELSRPTSLKYIQDCRRWCRRASRVEGHRGREGSQKKKRKLNSKTSPPSPACEPFCLRRCK